VLAYVAEPALFTPSMRPGPVVVAPTLEQERAEEALLERVIAEEDVAGAEPRVVRGYPAESLADLADDEDAELIVVGSRGRGAVRAALLGSVSTELIGVARCPVLVVPRGAMPATASDGS
jgi:nucleotide-binding universal stress UspA family protein